MKLLTQEHIRRLLANGRWNQSRSNDHQQTDDFRPVVKFFYPWGGATWLLTELDPDEPDIAFGLCDLGIERQRPVELVLRPREIPRPVEIHESQ